MDCDGLYFIMHNLIMGLGFIARNGLERKLQDKDFLDARKEYKEQIRLYKKGELGYRPKFSEVYEKYKSK